MTEPELRLQVIGRDQLSEDVIRLVLGPPNSSALPAWRPGAHVELVHEDFVRQYSLTGDPDRTDRWELAVRRPAVSRGGATWVYEALHVGETVRVRGPRNHFPMHPGEEYLLIAGGIGITPLYPMALVAARSGARWHLVYGGGGRATMAYLRELIALAQAHPETGRVDVLPEDEHGLLPLAEIIGAPREHVQIYGCGPESLLDAIEDACVDWPAGALHVERYAPRSTPTAARRAPQTGESDPGTGDGRGRLGGAAS